MRIDTVHREGAWIALRALTRIAAVTAAVLWSGLAGWALDHPAKYVPADAGLVIEVSDLSGTFDRFLKGAWPERWDSVPAFRKWRTDNEASLHEAALEIGRHLGIPAEELGRGLGGGRVLLAVWPPKAGVAEGPGLGILQATDASVLSRVVEGLQEAQSNSGGNGAVQDHRAAGQSYFEFRNVTSEGVRTAWMAQVDELLLVANNESTIVLALERVGTNVESRLADLDSYKEAVSRRRAGTVLSVYVNPRPWDAAMAEATTAESGELIRSVWPAVEYVGIDVSLESQWEVSLHSRVAGERLPPVVQAVVTSLSADGRFLRCVPQNALAALAMRLDFPAVLRQALVEAPAEDRQSFSDLRSAVKTLFGGWDPLSSVIESMGPDAGGYLVASNENADDPWDLDGVLGVALKPAPAEGEAETVAQVIDGGLRTAMTLSATVYNSRHGQAIAQVSTRQTDEVQVTSIEGLPLADRPLLGAYTLTRAGLFAGRSPGEVLRSARLAEQQSLAGSPLVLRARERSATPAGLFLWFDLRGLRRYVAEHRELLVDWTAESTSADPRPPADRVADLEAVLGVADSLLLTAGHNGGLIEATFRFDLAPSAAVEVPRVGLGQP